MPSTVLSGLRVLTHSILTAVLGNGSDYDHSHYTDGETEARKVKQVV